MLKKPNKPNKPKKTMDFLIKKAVKKTEPNKPIQKYRPTLIATKDYTFGLLSEDTTFGAGRTGSKKRISQGD